MFKKVLIANRGEIAIRVIRACRELGIATVAVYSQADAQSLHVSLADEAYCIGPAQSAKSYLHIPALISVALTSGADAIHPGYGFLSERADFVDICEEHHIKFIGPSSTAMRKMGDKATARATMEASGVPITPGLGIVDNTDEIREFVKKVGYPIIIKATAGGGGKGMRIVREDSELDDAFNLCRAEAQNSFANPDVYVEKFVENPRHIEVQILADSYGNVIHLGERDCSIQRRNQKLLEEAPSVAITDDIRKKMGEAAVNAAKAIKYEGTGTLEFLLDESDKNNKKFYFMEMNTRVQVEHCVTEMISNIDIVKEQIRVAQGEKLSYTQNDVKLIGHAIECRINAEDYEKCFMPCPGQIEGYIAPGGFGTRVDSHVYPGYKIPPFYDSLVGKVICWGKDREEARRRMLRALNDYIITGVKTTAGFHKKILNNYNFISGNFNTSFIDTNYPEVLVKK
ncbi:MAG: acetyl-CoA carboxylase biotin carboxylase subunit [Candidatus Gastranaerophilales bacterium]|nr:acetyl-CoA carboxylase biotin carboxylase subunit [Candidatus Gastranaerophilales bacterium]